MAVLCAVGFEGHSVFEVHLEVLAALFVEEGFVSSVFAFVDFLADDDSGGWWSRCPLLAVSVVGFESDGVLLEVHVHLREVTNSIFSVKSQLNRGSYSAAHTETLELGVKSRASQRRSDQDLKERNLRSHFSNDLAICYLRMP